MTEDRLPSPPGDEVVPWLVSGAGVVLGLAFFVETAVFSGLDPDRLAEPRLLVGVVLVAPAVAGLLYGGYWLARSTIDPERYPRVAWWTLGGSVVLFVIALLLQLVGTEDSLWVTAAWLRGSLTIGGATGLLIGVVEARAIHHAVEAERSELRAGYLEAQRDWLDYLNGLLRHEVLNTAQVVVGYVDVILREDDLAEQSDDRLRAVRRQTRNMTEVIHDVRFLIEATHGADDLEPVDLAAVVREEVQNLRDTHVSIAVDVDIVEGVTVWGDTLLPRVFSNLLSNAVEHNDRDEPTVAVSVERTGETAVVRVADDGPGVPPDEREDLFERSHPTGGDPGVGLHVVSLLVDRYGGEVELVETGPSGSVFAVELRLADADEPASTARSSTPGSAVPAGPPEPDPDDDREPPDRDAGAGDADDREVDGDRSAADVADPQPDGGPDEGSSGLDE